MKARTNRIVIALVALLVGAGSAAAVCAAVWSVPPPSLAEPSAARSVPIVFADHRDERSAAAAVTTSKPASVSLARGGIVTSSECIGGASLESGRIVASIDGRPILGLATAVPVFRELRTGAFIAETLAARWNVVPGDTVATDQGAFTIAGVFPYTERDGRDPRFANAVLLPVLPTGRFDACLAEVWPSTSSRDGLLRGTAERTDGKAGGASVSLLNQSFGTTWEGSADFGARVTRFAPVGAAILGAVLGAGAVMRRRLEFSAALHVGVSPGRLAVIVATETALWAVVAASGAQSAATIAGAILSRETLATTLAASALTCAAGALAAIAGALAMAGSLREDRLFRHFKNRA